MAYSNVPFLRALAVGLQLLICNSQALPSSSQHFTFDAAGHEAENQVVLGGPGNGHPFDPHRAPMFPQREASGLTGFVAFGDSYSAGIGTGLDGKEEECRRGIHAYPELILADFTKSQGPNTTTHQFLSCTGATIEDLLAGGVTSQIDAFNTTSTADFATLSIGGNDLGFFDVLNACVFRFYNFYSGTCETALKHADEQIASPDFEHRLQVAIMEILDKVQWEKRPWFKITMIGYTRFFNTETDECDDFSFGIWWQGPKLKRKVRQRMNDMVLAVNAKLAHSVAMINARFSKPKLYFVDYDAKFEGHRFCEPNVTEPDYNRTETWFFLVGGPDNNPNIQDPSPSPNATTSRVGHSQTLPLGSPLTDPDNCLDRAQKSGDWGMLALCYMAKAKKEDPNLRFANQDIMTLNSMWYVPTYYGKTFHPRSLAHEAIRDEIYKTWLTIDE